MRRQEATARRYAKALFLLGRDSDRLEATGKELATAVEVLAADSRLREFLTRPWGKGSAKRTVTLAVADATGCSKLVKDFLGLLAARGRMDHAAEIARAYRDLVDGERRRVRAEVRTSTTLSGTEREQLAGHLARIVGKEVVVEESVDPTLLGGFVAQVGSVVLDGSVNRQLARMRERLVRG